MLLTPERRKFTDEDYSPVEHFILSDSTKQFQRKIAWQFEFFLRDIVTYAVAFPLFLFLFAQLPKVSRGR